jgi:hypothetical protein
MCALAAGDESAAFGRAKSLRRLGQIDAPDGVSAADWSRFPELDAEGNVGVAEVAIDSKYPGSIIWVDFVKVGPAKVAVYLERGPHVIAASGGPAVASKIVDVSGWSQAELLAPAASGRWIAADVVVDRLRSGGRSADAMAVTEVLAITGAAYLVLLLDGGISEVWARDDSGAEFLARRRSDTQAIELIARAARPARAPDPERELLRESDLERRVREANKADRQKTKWWVYAAVIGAAIAGAGIIIVGDSGDDRQRFEIELP